MTKFIRNCQKPIISGVLYICFLFSINKKWVASWLTICCVLFFSSASISQTAQEACDSSGNGAWITVDWLDWSNEGNDFLESALNEFLGEQLCQIAYEQTGVEDFSYYNTPEWQAYFDQLIAAELEAEIQATFQMLGDILSSDDLEVLPRQEPNDPLETVDVSSAATPGILPSQTVQGDFVLRVPTYGPGMQTNVYGPNGSWVAEGDGSAVNVQISSPPGDHNYEIGLSYCFPGDGGQECDGFIIFTQPILIEEIPIPTEIFVLDYSDVYTGGSSFGCPEGYINIVSEDVSGSMCAKGENVANVVDTIAYDDIIICNISGTDCNAAPNSVFVRTTGSNPNPGTEASFGFFALNYADVSDPVFGACSTGYIGMANIKSSGNICVRGERVNADSLEECQTEGNVLLGFGATACVAGIVAEPGPLSEIVCICYGTYRLGRFVRFLVATEAANDSDFGDPDCDELYRNLNDQRKAVLELFIAGELSLNQFEAMRELHNEYVASFENICQLAPELYIND